KVNLFKSPHVFLIVVFLLGAVVGGFVAVKYVQPFLEQNNPEKNNLEKSYNLCTEEVTCYLQKCSPEAKEFCSNK
ncbi:MAG: hypothetical protein Q7K42_00750, partial [Candidatus Diapherotrites archaeon]|nr:hypothetical protein [Candidatus Diapherotrites archaeon]